MGALLLATEAHADGRFGSAFQFSNPMAQINDVYAWMADSTTMNLAMTVSPLDNGNRNFGPSVQYVFHLTSHQAVSYMNPPSDPETKVICVFASNTSVQCWVTDANGVKASLTGDPSSPAGIATADGNLRLFAGRRSDPFFFNLQGFRDAVPQMIRVANLHRDGAGCPSPGVDPTMAIQLSDALIIRNKLAEPASTSATAPCTANSQDCFASLNVMAIVLQIDTSLVNAGTNRIVSVWASTHAGQ